MTIHTYPINPSGQSSIQYNAGKGKALPGFTLAPGASDICYKNITRPAGVVLGNDRYTLAVDVCMTDGFSTAAGRHFVATNRGDAHDPLNNIGTRRWHGIICGHLDGDAGRVMSEGRSKAPAPNTHAWGNEDNQVLTLSEHTWYRYVIETMTVGSRRLYQCRVFSIYAVLNNVVGPLVHISPVLEDTSGTCADTDTLMWATVSSQANMLQVSRITAYWSNADEQVAIP